MDNKKRKRSSGSEGSGDFAVPAAPGGSRSIPSSSRRPSNFDDDEVTSTPSGLPAPKKNRLSLMPNTGDLVEDNMVQTIIKVLQSPPYWKMDLEQLRVLLGRYDALRHSVYSSLLEDSGQSLLRTVMMDNLYSMKFLQLLKDESNEPILKVYGLLKTLFQTKFATSVEIVKLTRLMEFAGLDVALHPLIHNAISKEMSHSQVIQAQTLALTDSVDVVSEKLEPPKVSVKSTSVLFAMMLRKWTFALSSVKKLSNAENAFQSALNRSQILSFLQSTSYFVKLILNLRKKLQSEGIDPKMYEFIDMNSLLDWCDIILSALWGLASFEVSEVHKLYRTILESVEYMDCCNWFELELGPRFFTNLITIAGWQWLASHSCHLPKTPFSTPKFVKSVSNQLKIIKMSSILTAKAIRTLRLNIFRFWNDFVVEIYFSIMTSTEFTFDNFPVLVELLDAISDVSWPFKELELSSTLTFLDCLIRSKLWEEDTSVRSCLGSALNSLPCIFCHHLTYQSVDTDDIPLKTGCENCSLKNATLTLVGLPETYVQKILSLATPLLQSKFLLVKLKLSDLIIKCDIHSERRSAIVALPMIEVAFNGKVLLCEEIFSKVGSLLVEEDKNNLENVCPYRQEIAQKIFGAAIPHLTFHALKRKNKHKLPLTTRTKILKGILKLSSVGPMSLSTFTEIFKCFISFLVQISANETAITMLGFEILAKFSEFHGCESRDLLSRIRNELCPHMIKVAEKEFFDEGAEADRLEEQVNKCVEFFNRFQFVGNFRRHAVLNSYYYPVLMEHIVPKLDCELSHGFLLDSLTRHSKGEVKHLLQTCVSKYLPTLLLEKTPESLLTCLQHVHQIYKFDVMFAGKQQQQRIFNEALCRLDDREQRVLHSLKFFSQWDEKNLQRGYSQSNTKPAATRTEIQELLNDKLFGVFIYVDNRVHSDIEPISEKQKILRSFAVLMNNVGKSKISPFLPMLYKTLNTLVDEGVHIYSEILHCWKTFASNLDDESFTTLTCPILAALLPLRELPSLRDRVDGLISHFVCYRKELTLEHYKDLYFLVDQCDSVDVRNRINTVITPLVKNNWFQYFDMILQAASNENYHIRYQAFRKLSQIFKFEHHIVEKLILGKGQKYASEIITKLLNCLRGGASVSGNEKLRLLAMDCFGSLGALDPVRFRCTDEDSNRSRFKIASLISNTETRVFAIFYIQELVREFQAAKDSASFDYCACLIQIALKEFGVTADETDPIWKHISRDMRGSIMPLFTSQYRVTHIKNLPKVECPIYNSAQGKTFENWLHNWLMVLIGCVTEDASQVHNLLKESLSLYLRWKNTRISSFIIPYVTLYAIICSTPSKREKIVTEVKTVLERWTYLDQKKQEQQNSFLESKDSDVDFYPEETMTVEEETLFHYRCTQVIYSILDHLLRCFTTAKRRWGLKKSLEQTRTGASARVMTPSPNLISEDNTTMLENLLNRIPYNLLSQVAFDYGSSIVALYYKEQELKINSSNEKLQNNLEYLQRIYVSLGDMDSVVGVSAIRKKEPSKCELILENIAQDKMEEPIKDLEQMINKDESNMVAHYALVQAYLNVEEPVKADTLISSILTSRSEWEFALEAVQLETMVKLKNWPDLKKEVSKVENVNGNLAREEKSLSWNIAISRTISKLECSEYGKALDILEKLKSKMIAPLAAACEETPPYKRAYNHIVQLHILAEIEEAIILLQKHSHNKRGNLSQSRLFQDLKLLTSNWETRLWSVSQSRKVFDQILYVRRNIFEIMKLKFQSHPKVSELLNSSIRECWLDIAKDAGKCGNFIRADNCLLQAKQFMSPKVFIEEAKILSRKGKKESAISVLQKGIVCHFPEYESWGGKARTPQASTSANGSGGANNGDPELKHLCSKAVLLLATLSEEQKLLNMEDYIAKYKEATDIYPDSEKNHFMLGSYYDRVWSSADCKEKNFEIQHAVVKYYSKSLIYGCRYVHQSLPRLLSIWFDFASGLQSGNFYAHSSGKPAETLMAMQSSIRAMIGRVPKYILMTAFTQLISRICHGHQQTWNLLKDIIVGIITTYPYQALWMTMAVSKSLNSTRMRRCREIYAGVEKTKPELAGTIKDYTNLSEKLILFCDKPIEKTVTKGTFSKVFDKLPKLIRSMGKVAVPFQIFMNPSLPQKGFKHKEHNPFPEELLYIEDLEDNFDVMPSLVRPKKITIRASNGKLCNLMCKPQDDLRKDSKVMEMNNLVNCYLSQNSEASQRRLHIRTYAVIPLNEKCGLLEWVNNLQGLRATLFHLYKEKNINSVKNMKNCIQKHDELDVKKKKFVENMLKLTPPVFSDWFFNNFPDQQSWYAARMAYIRTAAVMSIVGYVMGLGDRHGENILLDSTSGEVVHVDFNCLFNKGETFEVSERVPFRLTQNMVEAMGPLKYEGVFRRTCEIVMNMFREHKAVFLSVLRPFVFDPLVEWTWGAKDKQYVSKVAGAETGELTNEKAVETMKYIRNRLIGTARNMKDDINVELAPEAQVKYLIEEATSIDNLCQMYFGWAAYM